MTVIKWAALVTAAVNY